jgi:methionine synthase II (cobalamin-independent)
MFATIAGGYPLGPLPGGTEDLGRARARHAAGEWDAATLERAVDEWITKVVDEQIASGLAMVCDGDARWPDGPIGLARDLLSGRLGPADVVAAWRHADEGTNVLTKQVLSGPWSTSLALAAAPADRAPIARDLVTILGRTAQELAAAGCPLIQFDEPAATRGALRTGGPEACPDDLARDVGALLDAIPDGQSVCLGLPDGAPRADLRAPLAELPVESFLVDVTAGADAWRFIAGLVPEQGVMVGAIDARSPAREDPEMLVWAATLAAEMGGRGTARVGISASGSLAGLERHYARRKMEQAGMAVRLAAMGPLGEVARALQPDPATCRIKGLPELYAAWQDGTGGNRP